MSLSQNDICTLSLHKLYVPVQIPYARIHVPFLLQKNVTHILISKKLHLHCFKLQLPHHKQHPLQVQKEIPLHKNQEGEKEGLLAIHQEI